MTMTMRMLLIVGLVCVGLGFEVDDGDYMDSDGAEAQVPALPSLYHKR